MRERSRVVLVHLGDSVSLSVLAGVLVAVFSEPISNLAAPAPGFLADHGCFQILAVLFLSFGVLALLSPIRFVSKVESVKYLPFHLGIVAKVLTGIAFYVLTSWLMHLLVQKPVISLSSVLLLVAFCLGTLVPLWILARCVLLIKQKFTTSQTSEAKTDTWWLDDQPLDSPNESHFSQIEQVAARITDKLMLDRRTRDHAFPSIALIGAYGAGKTSICNIVRSLWDARRKRSKRVFFCRFEGWQFLSPEAAVRDLLQQVTHTILDAIDAPELWRIPQKYIESLTEMLHPWAKSLVPWLGVSESPREIASAVGGVLVRTNTRLVIFVDDFDRMEDDSLDAQKAVARALNQIQNLPNVQYILALGPRFIRGEQPTEHTSSTDLLKLTRFQELVPELDGEKVLYEVRGLRDSALNEDGFWYPWNRIDPENDDPLKYNPILERFGASQRFAHMLGGLIRTPRVFKAVLRETITVWDNGLRGELNWYDVILLNAIRAACPSVSEWIARDRATFIGHPGFHRRIDTNDNAILKDEARELRLRTARIVGGDDPALVELITNALMYLFPTFAARIDAHPDPSDRPPWEQHISYSPLMGSAYIERFFAGQIAADDVPDQVIFRFIRKTNDGTLDREEFERQFLSTQETIRKRMNALVRFAGLLEVPSALAISGCILDWASSLEHPEEYMDDYPRGLMPDIVALLKNCEDRRYEPGSMPEEPDPIEAWLAERIHLCTPETAVQTTLLVHHVVHGSVLSPDTAPRWQKELGQALCQQFLEDGKPFRDAVRHGRYSLLWLLEGMSGHDEYERLRSVVTERLLAEAAIDATGLVKSRLVHVLVDDKHAPMSGEPPLESYEFAVNQERNAKLLDMDKVVVDTRTWDLVSFNDEVSRRAFLYFKNSYGLSPQ